jgi:hypothetical protein
MQSPSLDKCVIILIVCTLVERALVPLFVGTSKSAPESNKRIGGIMPRTRSSPKPRLPKESKRAAKRKTAGELEKLKKIIASIDDARAALDALNRPHRMASPGLTRREKEEIATKLGLDPKAMGERASKDYAELMRLLRVREVNSAQNSAMVQKTLASQVAAWVDNNNVATLGGITQRYLINEPDLILPNGMSLDEAEILPLGSIVKFRSEEDGQNVGNNASVTFYFTWRNPGSYTLVSADGYVIMNGLGHASTQGGYYIDAPNPPLEALVKAYPEFLAYGFSNTSFNVVGDDTEFDESGLQVTATAHAESFYVHSAAVSQTLVEGFDMHIGPFAVPASQEVLFAIRIWVSLSVDGVRGSAYADFSSDAYNITTPGIIVTKWR